ncbi:MAG TPA: AAA family ATPase [Fimbriimonadaceae bacterium]|nr:AAA family ATPase [Fimbriimonadaceae bacterium]HRJ96317.1 AAA family ATPase [Fimbriimonadaceae bacterium]
MAVVVLVAGVSCSGKTTLARRLATDLDAAYISIDDYYRPFASLSIDDRKRIDFDAPEAIDVDLLVDHVRLLKASETIHKPLYDAAAYARLQGTEPIYPNALVVIEGLFALHWTTLAGEASLRVFVETRLEACRDRRVARDVGTYGRTLEESLARYERNVAPSQERYVIPSRAMSDIVVRGDEPLEHSLQAVRAHLGWARTKVY